jgi:hypothetical protein
MKSFIFRACMAAFLGVALLTGCQAVHDIGFSPIEPRLNPAHAGGAKYFVLVNSSGQTLHHFSFRAYMWGDSAMTYAGDPVAALPQRAQQQTYTFQGSGSQWEVGQGIHFRDRRFGGEGKILWPISKIQIVGSCDEGSFREDWQINSAGRLEQVGTPNGRPPAPAQN